MDGVCGKATTSLSRAKRTRKVEGGGFLPEKEAVPMKQLLGLNQDGRRKINMSQTEKDLLKILRAYHKIHKLFQRMKRKDEKMDELPPAPSWLKAC
jgi:hypothetical protein